MASSLSLALSQATLPTHSTTTLDIPDSKTYHLAPTNILILTMYGNTALLGLIASAALSSAGPITKREVGGVSHSLSSYSIESCRVC